MENQYLLNKGCTGHAEIKLLWNLIINEFSIVRHNF